MAFWLYLGHPQIWWPTMRRLDPSSGPPLYRQVADELRNAIETDMLRPGQLLPTEASLADGFGVSVDAVRAGLGVLRWEGLIVTERGKGSRVRELPEPVVLRIPPGATIRCRMPTPQERSALGEAERRTIPDGVPVLEVERDGHVELFAGDRFTLETVESEAD
jgi:DNA-binding transcriptional MocR family regulator